VRRRAGWLPGDQDELEAWLAGHRERVDAKGEQAVLHPVPTESQELIHSDPVVPVYLNQMIAQVPRARHHQREQQPGGHALPGRGRCVIAPDNQPHDDQRGDEHAVVPATRRARSGGAAPSDHASGTSIKYFGTGGRAHSSRPEKTTTVTQGADGPR
jgi:hypothetical protein